MRKFQRLIAGTLVIGSLIISTPAFAHHNLSRTTTTAAVATLDGLKAKATEAIDKRLATLDTLDKAVDAAENLESSHKTALESKISNARSGLTALKTKIAADADIKTVAADTKLIVTDYRVYLVLAPQVHAVITADRQEAIANLFDQYVEKWDDTITQAAADGRNVTDARESLDALKQNLEDADIATDDVAETALTFTPQGYPKNKEAIASLRESLQTGREDLGHALENAHKVRDAVTDL